MSMLFAALTTWLAGCSGTSSDSQPPPDTDADRPAVNVDVEIPRVAYAWDPQAGDASVSAELGGPGFTGEGWETNDIAALGNPDAPQGGELSQYIPDWPATLRLAGKDWNTYYNYHIGELVGMTLLNLDPVTLEFVPALATHWQVLDDGMRYRFRINPEARWSDGEPVVAQDVVATYKLRMDDTLLMPSNKVVFGKFEVPTVVSKYVVEVKVKEKNWRNLLYFSNQIIFPSHVIGDMTGAEFLDAFQFSYPPMSGPYIVKPEDIVTNQSVTVTRNRDWWADDNPAFDGRYNLERIKYVVIKDPNLVYQKTKKGEIDYYAIPKAKWYADELPQTDIVKRGLLIRRKFLTDNPSGVQGIAINMTRKPLDELPIRKALQLLMDRKTMIEKLYYNEYVPHQSYFPGGIYENPDNELYEYDELGAVELLEQAGFTEINSEGYRERDGKELELTLTYRTPTTEAAVTIYQEACKRAGIKIVPQLLTPAAGWKNMLEKQYELTVQPWGALLFPNPETSYKSSLATELNNNNVTGFANEEVDQLLAAYDAAERVDERVRIIREIDAILYREHPYVLWWYNPAQRVVYWNKYGMPEPWGAPRYGRYIGDRHLTDYWWYDADKDAKLQAALKDPTLSMEIPTEVVEFWKLWGKAQEAKAATGAVDAEPAGSDAHE